MARWLIIFYCVAPSAPYIFVVPFSSATSSLAIGEQVIQKIKEELKPIDGEST